jgi:hypothetical protein
VKSKKQDDLADSYLQGLTYYREKFMAEPKTNKQRKARATKKKNI